MRKGPIAYYSAEADAKPHPNRLVYLVVISVVLHVYLIGVIQYPTISSKSSLSTPIKVTIKPIALAPVSRQDKYLAPSQPVPAVSATADIITLPDKPRINAAQLISRSLEQVRRFEEKPLPGFSTNVIDKRVVEVKIETPVSIFSQADQSRQYQRTDGNTWIKIASIFGGYQCFIVRPADPLVSLDRGAWYMMLHC